MSYKVHVGFGFHVNCYHSYRGDTDDEYGFGGDIRTIRYILNTLDKYNAKGIPVKGTWDFENAYSLEEILPKHAPDIIKRVKERQKKNGDENILMSYNNGALSAMTKDEFCASVKWAISNDKESGLRDVFGSYVPVVRPQEMMFTPSDASLYQEIGIHTVCLYYSCVPFDGFRTILPKLTEEQAYNPLTYRYKNGQINILPTYSHSDIMDIGSLHYWVKELHRKQMNEEINRDVFLFINIDADSFLWEPFPVPGFLKKRPNFNGLEGLIEEIKELPYVVFDTPGNYLENHECAGEIFFEEDIADGNFSGYSSWAEKPFNRLIWTRLERARMYAALYKRDKISPSFEERIKLLSTTHFGLASPVLNYTREQTALELSNKMVEIEEATLREKWEQKEHKIKENQIWLKNISNSSFITTQLMFNQGFCRDIRTLKVKGKQLYNYVAVPMQYWGDGSVKSIYLMCRFEKYKKKYKMTFHIKKENKNEQEERECFLFKDEVGTQLHVLKNGKMPHIYSKKGELLASIDSWITYHGRKFSFNKPEIKCLALAGNGVGIKLTGEIFLPGEVEHGTYTYTFFSMKKERGIYVISEIQYPYTRETEAIACKSFNLGRYTDSKWEEVVPMEFTMELSRYAKVGKRNFMNDYSAYRFADFWEAYPQNSKMYSMNHQLTGGFLAIHDSDRGMVFSHARQVSGSMAHAPIRYQRKGEQCRIKLNAYGTYYGKQRYYPSAGNGSVMEIFNLTMPQAKSLAPSYNGAFERTIQRVSDYRFLNRDEQADIEAFADGCIVYATSGAVQRFREDNVKLHEEREVENVPEKLKILPSMDKSWGEIVRVVRKFLSNQKIT